MNAVTGGLALVHPVVRVVSFIFFSLILALGDFSQLVVAAALLCLLFIREGLVCVVQTWPMLRRMRWFFFSIFVIYLWLTPGRPLWAGADEWLWMPTIDGVLMGGHRLLALVLMLLAVHWLLWVTSRRELVSALYWMAMPLIFFGFSRERFALRIALVFATIEQVQCCVTERMKFTNLERGNLRGYANIAAGLVSDIVKRGEEEICLSIEIDVEDAPVPWQWLWVLALIGMMMSAA